MKHLALRVTLSAAFLSMGCGTDTANFFIGNPGLPPVAVNDTFTVLGNGILSGLVTANDTPNSGTVSNFQNPSALGGTVSLNAVGQLTYTPPVNQTNVSDTFTYTLSNSVGNSSATVTVQIGARGFFVKNDVATSGSGTQASPFKTLAEAVSAATNIDGAQIVLFRGDGTSTNQNTGFTLGTNQGIFSLDAASPATIAGPVNLTTGNNVRDLRIVGSNASAINGTNASNATLSGLVIDAPADRGVSLTNCTGSFVINNSTIGNTVGAGVIASATTGSLTWSVTNSTFANVTERGVYSNTSLTASQNVTLVNVTTSGGGDREFFSVDALGAGPIGLNLHNNNIQGSAVRPRGIGILTLAPVNLTALVSGNNITNCTTQGMLMIADGGANLKTRVTGNRLTGNLGKASFAGLTPLGSTNSFSADFQNNTADNWEFSQFGTSTFAIESFDQFDTASNNTGTVSTTGTITNAPANSLGIP